jgi:hypothetical protein
MKRDIMGWITLFAAASAALVGLTGCLTHTVTLDLRASTAVWQVEGDTLDLQDGRLPLPGSLGWTFVGRQERLDPEGNRIISRTWTRELEGGRIPHPLADSVGAGWLAGEMEHGLLLRRGRAEARFPGWEVSRLYGDPEAYAREDIADWKARADTLRGPGEAEQEEQVRALAMQRWAADRYLAMARRVVREHYRRQGRAVDSAAVAEAADRFGMVLDAHLLTLRGEDPREVSLEWYRELRGPMVAAASEATGEPLGRMGPIADSLDARYRRWLDLEDDSVILFVVAPGWWVGGSEPDTVRGDTLAWSFEGELLADSTVALEVTTATPTTAGLLLPLILVVLFTAAVALRRLRA